MCEKVRAGKAAQCANLKAVQHLLHLRAMLVLHVGGRITTIEAVLACMSDGMAQSAGLVIEVRNYPSRHEAFIQRRIETIATRQQIKFSGVAKREMEGADESRSAVERCCLCSRHFHAGMA